MGISPEDDRIILMLNVNYALKCFTGIGPEARYLTGMSSRKGVQQ